MFSIQTIDNPGAGRGWVTPMSARGALREVVPESGTSSPGARRPRMAGVDGLPSRSAPEVVRAVDRSGRAECLGGVVQKWDRAEEGIEHGSVRL